MTVKKTLPLSLRISHELHAELTLEAATMKGTLTDAGIRRLEAYFGGEAPGPKPEDPHFRDLCCAKKRSLEMPTKALADHVAWLNDRLNATPVEYQKEVNDELAIYADELLGRGGEKVDEYAAIFEHHARAKQEYTAIGIFQGDADWNIEVKVKGFKTEKEATIYANHFKIRLREGRLFQAKGGITNPPEVEWHEVLDADVTLARLKQSVSERIVKAHLAYAERGLDNIGAARDSMKVFEAEGHHDLVTSEGDYESVNLPISQWHTEPGLTCGFGSLAWSVENENLP